MDRDPSSSLLQRTFSVSGSILEHLSSDGELMLITDGERFLSDITGELNSVDTIQGHSINANGTWYVILGRSLFEVSL